MPDTVNDRTHEEFQDLLAAAAFGTITDEEWVKLRGHLDECAECQRELGDFQFIAAVLPLTLDERQPELRLRNRILAMVQHEHRSPEPSTATVQPVTRGVPESPAVQEAPRPEPRRAPTPIRHGHLWATAALVLLSLLAGAAVGRFLLADEPDPDSEGETIAMRFSTPILNLQSELTYNPDQQVLRLTVNNMPPAPADHVYQVWLIDESGPIPAGVIDTSSGEFAVAADRARYQTLAVTVEPGPLGSVAPTTEPIITAPLTGAD